MVTHIFQLVKNLPVKGEDSRDTDSISGLKRSLRVGKGNILQYFCLEYSMERVTWWAIVHEVAKN